MKSKFSIVDNDNKQSKVQTALNFLSIYVSVVFLVLLLTIPTKGVWLLISLMWNLF